MSGLTNLNYPAFRAAATRLRDAGFSVISPNENFDGDVTRQYNEYLRLDIQQVAQVDAVALLDGWENSKGAGIETAVAGLIGIPLVCAETLLPVSREKPKPDAYHPLVAFAGYARCGKDEAGKAFIDLGYARRAFGDVIKKRMSHAPVTHLGTVLEWVHKNEDNPTSDLLTSLYNGFMQICHQQICPFTENDIAKAIIRPILERYGEAFYDEILCEFMDELPDKAVNTRIVRCKEAEEWRKRGGIIIEVVRGGAPPATAWERDRLEELRAARHLHATVFNLGTIEELHQKALRSARL